MRPAALFASSWRRDRLRDAARREQVLVPLPLFMRKPSPPLPGIVVVWNEPRFPVMKAGPLDVRNDWPGIDACRSMSAGPLTRAQAVPSRPVSNAIAMTAIDGLRTTKAADLKELAILLSFPECEQRLRRHARTVCSGRQAGFQSRLPPARHVVLHRPVCDAGSVYGDMCERNGPARPLSVPPQAPVLPCSALRS